MAEQIQASVKVKLDLEEAKKEVKKFEKEHKEQARSFERSQNRMNLTNQAEKTEAGGALKKIGAGVKDFVTGEAAGEIAIAAAIAAGVAEVMEQIAPIVTDQIKSLLPGSLAESFGKPVDEFVNEVSDLISYVKSYITTVYPAAKEAAGISKTVINLGGSIGVGDAEDLFMSLKDIKQNQDELERNMDKDLNKDFMRRFSTMVKARAHS